jgi:hypothetical protein
MNNIIKLLIGLREIRIKCTYYLRSKTLWRWYICTNIVSGHYPSSCLYRNTPFRRLILSPSSTQLSPIDRASPHLRNIVFCNTIRIVLLEKDRTMDKVQKHNFCKYYLFDGKLLKNELWELILFVFVCNIGKSGAAIGRELVNIWNASFPVWSVLLTTSKQFCRETYNILRYLIYDLRVPT